MSTRNGTFTSALGELLIVADGDAIIGVYFSDHRYPPAPDAIGDALGAEPDDTLLAAAATQLREYLDGGRKRFELPVAPQGDEFSQRLWRMLQDIPFGETTSYGELASALGNRALAQRVGQAVGHNPVSIIIPCHRVLGANGTLTGYAGGLDRKRRLLTLEEPAAVDAGRLF